ncbi:MAG TPA: hypothetical protein VF533_15260 [Solirubrobacteraceae bacterium]|jgi:hypothetical protein
MRRHLTFANVCSFIALTVALGTGGAYAANTVFSADIVDGEVKTADLGASAVTAAKVAPESLSTGRIFGLTGADVVESTLARVPDAAKLGGVAAKPTATLVKPGATDHDACAAGETGRFCTIRLVDDGWLEAAASYGGDYQAARFYRDAFGVVHLEGLVSTAINAPTLFVLPAGSRPAASRVFATVGREIGEQEAAAGRIDVKSDGRVVVMQSPSRDAEPGPYGSDYLTLDGISFRTG